MSTEHTPRPDDANLEAALHVGEKQEHIELRGVRTHNLKGIDCKVPHNKFTVVTGLSGSGKSSLAFDTLYAEGQRRYTESLSTYARQFLQQLERPPVDFVRNIQPAVALKQKNEVQNARSTVGTVTEIDDHLHLLFTHIGVSFCPSCGERVTRDSVNSAVENMLEQFADERAVLVAQVPVEDPKHRPAVLEQLVQEGFTRLYVGGESIEIEEGDVEMMLSLESFPVIVDRVVVRGDDRMRLAEALDAGLSLGKGRVDVYRWREDEPLRRYDQSFNCSHCGYKCVPPQPALFSFNSSLGACTVCSGFGKTIGLDFKKVIPNPTITLERGAIVPFETSKYRTYKDSLLRACRKHGVPIDLPFRKLAREHQRFVKEGGKGWVGVRGFFKKLEQKQYKTHVRIFLARYRGYDDCEACMGSRLSADARAVKIHEHSISDFWEMRIEEVLATLEAIEFTENERARGQVLLDEVLFRLRYLVHVGLGYLTLGRQSRTLSGGEMQRIHLTTSLGRSLTDTLYVLDEPTAGLHARDSAKLVEAIYRLRDLGNTVVVVEHDPEIIEAADHVIELGPGSGEKGGELVFDGDIDAFRAADTLTATSLHQRIVIERVAEPALDDAIAIIDAREHNLDDLTVRIPHGKLTCVTGVSGSGKSTLMHKTLYNGWRRMQGQGGVDAGAVGALEGLDVFMDVVMMTQSAIGRSARSNALSYTKAYDDVRKVFSQTEHARKSGLTVGDFSFNTPGGRCENCQGTGTITIEMHFMADIEITCPECQGKRFTERVLAAEYRGHSIHDVLEMTVDDALEFFANTKPIVRKLQPLADVGLGYLRLGQPTTTLSGGEAQRLKLATYISQGKKRGAKKVEPILFIFDEPTVGLHLKDVEVLLGALRQLVDLGHTVIVIEHNTDLIVQSDFVVDLGPGAGPRGGKLVVAGTPEQVAACAQSETGRFLERLL